MITVRENIKKSGDPEVAAWEYPPRERRGVELNQNRSEFVMNNVRPGEAIVPPSKYVSSRRFCTLTEVIARKPRISHGTETAVSKTQ